MLLGTMHEDGLQLTAKSRATDFSIAAIMARSDQEKQLTKGAVNVIKQQALIGKFWILNISCTPI